MTIQRFHELLQADIRRETPFTGRLNAQRMVTIQALIKQAIQSGRPLQYSIFLGHLAEHTRFPFNRVDAWQMALDMARRNGGAA